MIFGCITLTSLQNLMSQKGYTSQQEEINFNRSCNSKIENHILNQNQSQDTFKFRTVRSQKQLNTYQEQQYIEPLSSDVKLLLQKKAADERYQKGAYQLGNEIEKRAFALGEDIIHSEEISLEQQMIGKDNASRKKSNSLKDHLIRSNEENAVNKQNNIRDDSSQSEQTHKKASLKEVNLNILLLGKSGIGKTSFVDCFIDKKYENMAVIRQRSEQMATKCYQAESNNAKYKINLIDMPGYRENKLPEYIKEVYDFIRGKYRSHLNAIKERKDCHQMKVQMTDQRVHCCIFFLSGPWVSDYDWQIMKTIENITNIIPIIAKGDTFTTSELREFKKNINLKLRTTSINWLSIEEIIRQGFPEKLGKLLEGSFGKSPPFVITCCNEKQLNEKSKKYELVRMFRWGKCQLQNESHNDFRFLKELIIYNLSSILVRYTDTFLRSYEETLAQSSPQHSHPAEYRALAPSLHQQMPKQAKEEKSASKKVIDKLREITYLGLTAVGLFVYYQQNFRLK